MSKPCPTASAAWPLARERHWRRFVGAQWALEFEAWFPGEVEDPGVRNGVHLFSASALRFVDDERRGPYMLFGLTGVRIEFGSSQRRRTFANGVQLGAGNAVRAGERTMVVPELRVNVIDGGALLIRPSVVSEVYEADIEVNRLATLAVFTGIGAGLGLVLGSVYRAVDRNGRLLYAAPPSGTVRLSSFMTQQRRGIQVALVW